jgi:DNA-binding CsgD family transcriptional regulator
MLKSTDAEVGRGPGTGAIATARRRRAPRVVIVNEAAQIVMTSSDPAEGDAADMPFSATLTATLIAEIESGKSSEVFALVSPTTVVRATPLNGSTGRFYALFVEYVESRDLLANASESYGLSLRELDVLRLVLHGMSTAEIAHRLCIAATTVHAHVKNIARKTKSTKRTEILAKLLGVR